VSGGARGALAPDRRRAEAERGAGALAGGRDLIDRRLLRVTANERLGAYRVLRAADPDGRVEPIPAAGQFAMLAASERWGGGEDERPFLPRAFSYARFDRGEAHFLLQDVGPGTRRLCELEPGEGLWALGPLGSRFAAPEQDRRALLVGGGVGIAPLAIWQDALDERRPPPPRSAPERRNHDPRAGGGETAATAVLLGFRDASHAAAAALLRGATLATDDGSLGHRGLVTDLLAAELDRDEHATVYACGPPPMLEAVRSLCERRGVPAQLALESGMACGFGACFGCVVPTRSGYARLCVEGPVLDAAELERVEQPGAAALERVGRPTGAAERHPRGAEEDARFASALEGAP
jgi:dihydroorotate dehydrogenase electron transfer subunit